MKRLLPQPTRSLFILAALFALIVQERVHGEDLYLADGQRFPGELWYAQSGMSEQLVLRRDPQPNSTWPRTVAKVAQVAVGPDGKVFFCSGLDGSLMHILDKGIETQAFEIEGQIRDLACTGELNVVYFSVVATPQNGEPLADGQLFRCDLAKGELTQIATIGQADLGGNWWGLFTIRNGVIYLATVDSPSRIFMLTENGPQQVFASNPLRITGLTVGPNGDFWLASGDNNVTRTADFANLVVPFQASDRVGDVAIPAPREAVQVVIHEVLAPTCRTHFICIRPIPIICFYGCHHPVPWCHHHNHLNYVNNHHHNQHFINDKIKDAINHGKNGIISHAVLNAAIHDRLGDAFKGKLPNVAPHGKLSTHNLPHFGNKLDIANHGNGIIHKPLTLKPLNNQNGSNHNGRTIQIPQLINHHFNGKSSGIQSNGNSSGANFVPQIKKFNSQNFSAQNLGNSNHSFKSNSSGNGSRMHHKR